jgi:hypothetical protein
MNRKHRQLKRNPLVRFIRGVFRLLRVILKPKNRNLRSLQEQQSDLPQVELQQSVRPKIKHQNLDSQQLPTLEIKQRTLDPQQLELNHDRQEPFITVGELFDQIKWQLPAETVIQTNTSDLRAHQSYDPSRN